MNNSFFPSPEELLEQGVHATKNQIKATASQITGQVTGSQTQTPSDAGQTLNDQANNDFIKEMYQPTSLSKPHMHAGQQNMATAIMSQLTGQTSQDQKTLEETRKQLKLHQEQHTSSYFKQTLEQKPKHEERAQEKVQREEEEEKQKRWELQQKKEKDPIALTRATHKAEQFPGAAG